MRRSPAVALVVALLAGGGCAPGDVGPEAPAPDPRIHSADADCPGADRRPEGRADEGFRAAVACLLNAEREARDLEPLERHDDLAEAAQAHSDDMAARGYFAHVAPDGGTVDARAREAGYTPRRPRPWRVGENLGYATGRLATPRRMMRGWMQSPGHRENVLLEGFREVGIGLAFGSPGGDRPRGALATTVLGAR